ncbi:MAG: hypothetical protein KC620_14900, partial [Myxococcales bacterium]|nr:hypothetical protein [Myxococcales bacterium]
MRANGRHGFKGLAIAAGLAAALFALGCGDEVDCLLDSQCPTGQYCVSTRCAEPVPQGDYRTSYRVQVAPVIETGCNCHAPTSDRPWRYWHDFNDDAAFVESLRVLRQWLYDPTTPADAPGPPATPTAWGYGLAGCGFNHPGIYEGVTQPQYELLLAWSTLAWPDLPPSPKEAAPAPPALPDSLPAL